MEKRSAVKPNSVGKHPAIPTTMAMKSISSIAVVATQTRKAKGVAVAVTFHMTNPNAAFTKTATEEHFGHSEAFLKIL
jgi:hypothetical protein